MLGLGDQGRLTLGRIGQQLVRLAESPEPSTGSVFAPVPRAQTVRLVDMVTLCIRGKAMGRTLPVTQCLLAQTHQPAPRACGQASVVCPGWGFTYWNLGASRLLDTHSLGDPGPLALKNRWGWDTFKGLFYALVPHFILSPQLLAKVSGIRPGFLLVCRGKELGFRGWLSYSAPFLAPTEKNASLPRSSASSGYGTARAGGGPDR